MTMSDDLERARFERAQHDIMVDTLGRVAYEAFIEHAPESNFLPPWGALAPEKRAAWRGVADAVRMFSALRDPTSPAHAANVPQAREIVFGEPLRVATMGPDAGGTSLHTQRFRPPIAVEAGDVMRVSPTAVLVFRGVESTITAYYVPHVHEPGTWVPK